jgi:hypothetical protein
MVVQHRYTRTLLDQRAAGKRLALITNSDWVYTNTMMHASYSPFLPEGMSWRDLFDVVVVSACKPEFFEPKRRPVYEIVTEDGMLRETFQFRDDSPYAYAGGTAALIERCFGVNGPRVLYVGDHVQADVNIAKRSLSWRTCLILQELEAEMAGLELGQRDSQHLSRLMRRRDLEQSYVNVLQQKRLSASDRGAEAPPGAGAKPSANAADDDGQDRLTAALDTLRSRLAESDGEIEMLQRTEGNHVNPYWGYMSRAGFADKSHLMRQIEKYADIYTSRVANLQPYTPFKQFLCQRQSLAHSIGTYSGRPLMEHWRIAVDEDDAESRAK